MTFWKRSFLWPFVGISSSCRPVYSRCPALLLFSLVVVVQETANAKICRNERQERESPLSRNPRITASAVAETIRMPGDTSFV